MYYRSMPYLAPDEVNRLLAGMRSNEPGRLQNWLKVFANLVLAPDTARRHAWL